MSARSSVYFLWTVSNRVIGDSMLLSSWFKSLVAFLTSRSIDRKKPFRLVLCPPHTQTKVDEKVPPQKQSKAKCRANHAPISASWSFSPAASCSSCEILAARSFDVSLGSATFFPLFFFDIVADDILDDTSFDNRNESEWYRMASKRLIAWANHGGRKMRRYGRVGFAD